MTAAAVAQAGGASESLAGEALDASYGVRVKPPGGNAGRVGVCAVRVIRAGHISGGQGTGEQVARGGGCTLGVGASCPVERLAVSAGLRSEVTEGIKIVVGQGTGRAGGVGGRMRVKRMGMSRPVAGQAMSAGLHNQVTEGTNIVGRKGVGAHVAWGGGWRSVARGSRPVAAPAASAGLHSAVTRGTRTVSCFTVFAAACARSPLAENDTITAA